MQKPNLYLSLLFFLILGLAFFSAYDIYQMEYTKGKLSAGPKDSYYTYTKRSLSDLQKSPLSNFIIVTPFEDDCLLCVIDQVRPDIEYNLTCNKVFCDRYEIEIALLTKVLDFESAVSQRKHSLPYGLAEYYAKTDQLKIYQYRKIDYDGGRGFFDFIDSSFFIFLLISIIYFCITTLLQFLGRLFKINHPKVSYGFKLLLLLGLGLFLWRTNTFISLEKNALLGFIMSFILLIPFFIFQHIILKGTKDLKFDLGETIKFISIILLLTVTFTSITFCLFELRDLQLGVTRLVAAFSFSVALGNLMVNAKDRILLLRKQNQNVKKLKEQNKQSQSQLNALQASVNPHFLYNTLNAIAGLAKTDPDKTETLAIQLSEFYKYTTNRNAKYVVELQEELDMIENYLKIEKVRFGDILKFEKSVDDAALNKKLPRFVLQPIVENAIKYGHDGVSINLKLEITLVNNELIIKLYDSGKAFSEELDKGFGLRSVYEKSELLFPDKHTIKFTNLPYKHLEIRYEQ